MSTPISFKARRIVVEADQGYIIAYPAEDTLPSVIIHLSGEDMARGIIEELEEYIRCNPSEERLQFERDQAAIAHAEDDKI